MNHQTPQQKLSRKEQAKAKRAAFKQQKLKSWRPTCSPRLMLTILFIVGVFCLPFGVGLLLASKQITETHFEYTRCKLDAPQNGNFGTPSSTSSAWTLLYRDPVASIVSWKYDSTSKTCTLRFRVKYALDAPVLMFIRLSNFLQNHRTYVKSSSTKQLKGNYLAKASDLETTSGGDPICGFLQYANCTDASGLTFASDTSKTPMDWYNLDCRIPLSSRSAVIQNAVSGAQYYPCGLAANSMFTDTISNLECISSDGNTAGCAAGFDYVLTDKNIAWPEDANRYGKSQWLDTVARNASIPTSLIPPPNWRSAFPQWANGYNSTNLPDLKGWERFHVWMRVSGLSTFRKTWARNDTQDLLKGIYEINIVDNFDVYRFNGTKSLVFSTTTAVGSSNYNFTSIAFFAVAGLCIGSTFVFGGTSYFWGRNPGDHAHLSWVKGQPQTSQANAARRPETSQTHNYNRKDEQAGGWGRERPPPGDKY